MTGNRQLRAWPASDGLVVGDELGVGDGVADGLAEAGGVVVAMGANPPQAANANTTTGSKTLLTSIQRLRAGPVTRRGRKTGDCQIDCQAGGLWRIGENRIDTASLILHTKWTLAGFYEHSSGALENCYRCKPILGSNPSPSATVQSGAVSYDDILEECRAWAEGAHYPLKRGAVGRLAQRVRVKPAAWWRAIRQLLADGEESEADARRLAVNLSLGPLAALMRCEGWPARVARAARSDERVAATLESLILSRRFYELIDRRMLVRGWLRMARDETHWANWAFAVVCDLIDSHRVGPVWDIVLETLRVAKDEPRVVSFVGAAILEDMPNELIALIEQDAPRNPTLVQALESAVAREMTPETRSRAERILGHPIRF
jgi:hypothetical protein